MRRAAYLIAVLGACLAGCQPTNPLGSSSAPSQSLNVAGVKEIDDGELILSPPSTVSTGGTRFAGITTAYGSGGASSISPIHSLGASSCPGANCRGIGYEDFRGVGGTNGDFYGDFFIRYMGVKGPDPSNDYSHMTINFSASGATERDLSNYKGIVFWARGHGNFSVNLVARKPGDGLSPANPPAGFPYADWNFYLKIFGNELAGDVEWKEIVVYFSDMVQMYGLAVDLQTVKAGAIGLQFDQQSPYTHDFKLDVDYVRLFK